MSRNRTPEQQAADFVRANNASPVVSGAALQEDPSKPSRGARYKLKSGRTYYLGAAACRLLPAGFPKWAL